MREPSSELIAVVQRSTLPALLLRVPSEEILAASEEAARLLGMTAAELVGRNAEDFTADSPEQVLDLVASGRLTGFQARRVVAQANGDAEPLQIWLRAADLVAPVEFAVVVVWPAGRKAWSYLPAPSVVERHQVIGTADGHLEVERVSDDVRLLGSSPEDAVGASLLRLVDITSAADVLQALAEATRTRQSVCLMVNVLLEDSPAMAQLMIRPLEPAPSFSFSFVCPGADWSHAPHANEQSLQQMGRGLHALELVETYALLDGATVPGIVNLSSRELDIVARLLGGDRVPAIAQALFLSQSTVRNHLSSVFRKLRVASQQELIELFRKTSERLPGQDTPSSWK